MAFSRGKIRCDPEATSAGSAHDARGRRGEELEDTFLGRPYSGHRAFGAIDAATDRTRAAIEVDVPDAIVQRIRVRPRTFS